MRDLPASLDLLALARESLLGELLPLLPPERARDAHLIATVMAIVAREAAGEGWQGEIEAELADFYAEAAPHPSPLPASGAREHADTPRPVYGKREGPAPRAWEGEGQPFALSSTGGRLLASFAADLRNGAFETSPSRAAAARVILWRLTIEKLREGNPHFLAANGLRNAGGQQT